MQPELGGDWTRDGVGLLLLRRVGERIFVGDDIVITVCSAERGRAKIGVKAPRDTAIDREEVRMRIVAGIPPPER